EKNYSDFFEKEHGILSDMVPTSIPISVDLSDINFPNRYRIAFYTDVYLGPGLFNDTRIADFTNWVDIPPTKFFISTFPEKIYLRPGTSGTSKEFTGILKSIDGSVPNVTSFRVDNNDSIIKVHAYGTSNTSSSGV